MKRFVATLLFAASLVAAPSWAQDVDPPSPQPPAISLPETIEGNPGEFLRIPATTNGQFVKWVSVNPGLNLFPVDLLKDTRTAVVTAIKPGEYPLLAYTAIADVPSDVARCVIVIRGPKPPPDDEDDEVDPTPEPGPTPGFGQLSRVLVLWESGAKMSASQKAVFWSTAVRERLDQICPVEAGVPSWRYWDKDIALAANVNPGWKDALSKAKAAMSSLPQVFLFDDKGVMFTAPLPGTEADFLALLEKHKGK